MRIGMPRAVFAIATLAASLGVAREAPADVGIASPAAVEAGKHFETGTEAFRRGDYATAGREFDRAYALTPHPDAAWNAAQAWERMQDLARAANRYSLYLQVAPEGAPDRDRAVAALARLAPRLARLDVYVRGEGESEVEVDGEPASVGLVFVYPGAHEVSAHVGTRTLRKNVDVRAGMVQSVVLTDDAAASPSLPAASSPPANAPAEPMMVGPVPERPSKGGLPAWVVFAGGGATLAALGVTIWSGFDTLSARDQFVSHPSEATFQGGRSAETRTNVLVAVTTGLGVATLAAAFFVHWR
jgi:hypothetical protein